MVFHQKHPLFWPWLFFLSKHCSFTLPISLGLLNFWSQTQLSYHQPITTQVNLIKAPIWDWCAAVCTCWMWTVGNFKLFLHMKQLFRCYYLDIADCIFPPKENRHIINSKSVLYIQQSGIQNQHFVLRFRKIVHNIYVSERIPCIPFLCTIWTCMICMWLCCKIWKNIQCRLWATSGQGIKRTWLVMMQTCMSPGNYVCILIHCFQNNTAVIMQLLPGLCSQTALLIII